MSFWVKATKTGTNAIWIYQNDDNRSQAQTYTVNSSNTWEKKVVVFAADTTGVIDNNNGEGFRINWWLTAGSNYTSGTLSTTWQSHVAANNAVGQVNNADSTSNNWYITGVQLEVGEFDSDTIPPFPFESFSNNLHKCRRYFVKSPKTDGVNHYSLHDMFTYDNSNCYAGYIFNPPMRAAPSISQTTAAEFLTNGTDKSITTDMLYSSDKDNETARIRFYDGNAFSDQNGKVGILQNGTFKFESEL